MFQNVFSGARLSLLLLFTALVLQAADPTGTIGGNVADPSGAALAGAKVTAINPATGLTRETRTAADGGYIFPLLPAGTYSIVVEAAGFRKSEQRGVEVKVNSNSTVDVALQLGSNTESVTVEANAEMVDTRSGTIAQVVSEQKIVELPLNGRNAATLVLLAPGTADLTASNARGSGDALQTASYPGAQSITSNGARSDGINYNLDGGSTIDHYTNVNNPLPNPDALQEFSVQTNNYSAEHGRASGAVVNAITKSGTNEFHGSAFEFLRNGALNARNFFAASTDKLKRNQFGGSLGGPIKHNQLFFFGTYQGTQIRNISSGNSAFVLTPEQRSGVFTSVTRQLIDPLTKQPFEGNRIPLSRLSPITAKLLPLIPISNSADGLIRFDRPVNDHENQVMGRLDYIHGSHRLYGRYFDSRYARAAVSGANNLVAAARGGEWFNRNASISHTNGIRPDLLNNFIFSYNKTSGSIISGAPFSVASIGVPIAGPNPPEINMTISGYFSISTGAPGDFDRHNFHFADSMHWIRGSHEFAFGGDFLRMNVDLANSYRQAGRFRFRGTKYSGDPRADFLIGYLDQFIQGGGEYAARRGNLGSAFVQDNWRANRQLTFNLGLRWDPFLPYTDELGRTECFRPGMQSQRFSKAPQGYLYAGDPGCPAGGSNSVWNQVSPRLGFAYNVGGGGKTIVRGGFGIFYQPPFVEAYNNMVDSAPFSPQVIRNGGVPLATPYVGLRNPFPAQYAPAPPAPDVTFDTPIVAVSYTPDWKPARMLGWNLTIEHQLGGNLLIRAGYVASKGTHLGFNTDVNAPRYFPGAADIDSQLRRPYSNFGLATMNTSGANSQYNSLQLGLDKRFAHGFTAGVNYTWAKSIDWTSYLTDLDGINVINPFNARAYRGVSDFNVPHRLIANLVWQLPSPKAGLARVIAGGWETSSILNWQSGFPLNISSGEDNSLTGIGNDNADVISKPGYTSGSRADRIQKWFTTESFRSNREGTFGTAGRNILRGPGTFSLSAAAHKTFQLAEHLRLQYRAEFFNAPNHTNLNNPGTTVTTSSFGRITSAGEPRIIQMALKLNW